jgi:hypothetical protein
MTPIEEARLYEIIFYLFFNDKSDEMVKNENFWNFIKSLCALYNLNYDIIVRNLRILLKDENAPSEKEIVYLLNKTGVTVRPMVKISRIYWQKQKKILEDIIASGPPEIKQYIFDPVSKIQIKEFVKAFYNVAGIFSNLDQDLIGGK